MKIVVAIFSFLCLIPIRFALPTKTNVTDNLQQNNAQFHTQMRNKRFVTATIEFLGIFFAEYAINKGVEAVEGLLDENDPIDKVQSTVDEIKQSVKELQKDVQQVGGDVLKLILGNAEQSFARDINSLNVEELNILYKSEISAYEDIRLQDILEQILDDNRGIESALRHLHTSIMGYTSYSSKNIIELYWNKLIHGVDMYNYRAIGDLREKVMKFVKYLLDMQAVGFTIWYTAVTAKHRDDKGAQRFYQKHVKDQEAKRLKEQEEYLAGTIFKPCKTIGLKDFPNRGKSLKCSDGFNFGSICSQRCSGSCAEQKIKGDNLYYPSVGFPAVQCLLNGKWSNNVKGKMVLACTFCSTEARSKKPLAFPQQCYEDGFGKVCKATHRTNVGLSNNKRCNKPCRGIRKFITIDGFPFNKGYFATKELPIVNMWKSWCYTGGNEDWDYCLPDKLTANPDRFTQGITIDGEKCRLPCSEGDKKWYWCYTETDWEYCT